MDTAFRMWLRKISGNYIPSVEECLATYNRTGEVSPSDARDKTIRLLVGKGIALEEIIPSILEVSKVSLFHPLSGVKGLMDKKSDFVVEAYGFMEFLVRTYEEGTFSVYEEKMGLHAYSSFRGLPNRKTFYFPKQEGLVFNGALKEDFPPLVDLAQQVLCPLGAEFNGGMRFEKVKANMFYTHILNPPKK